MSAKSPAVPARLPVKGSMGSGGMGAADGSRDARTAMRGRPAPGHPALPAPGTARLPGGAPPADCPPLLRAA